MHEVHNWKPRVVRSSEKENNTDLGTFGGETEIGLHRLLARPHLCSVASTNLTFASRTEHRAWLQRQSALPRGFRAGNTTFDFTPSEAPKPAKMTLTIIAADQPTPDFGAVFTRNAFPGAPVLVGRERLNEPALGAIVVNNKISNVCAPDGVPVAERIAAETARLLHIPSSTVLPSSTGVIGWSLPVDALLSNLPQAAAALQIESILPAADGIVTTDLYAKVRRADLCGGSIVGIAKGAGMIEPNLATMLVFILTDLAISRAILRPMLTRVVDATFNRISIDSDTSTSDTVAIMSNGVVPCEKHKEFEGALMTVCRDLAEDVVRNGEGVHHVMRVRVSGAPDVSFACRLGKAIVNAPLFKCAVAGNDPNVGRLVQAIGKQIGTELPEFDLSDARLKLGGIEIFSNGCFRLDPKIEHELGAYLEHAELYASGPPKDGVFAPAVNFPPHERTVDIEVLLNRGNADAEILGGDLTHEYVSENADYRT